MKNFLKFLPIGCLVAAAFAPQAASANLTITPVTWNVIGLDSNNVTVGPNVFPVGVRVANTDATTTATNVVGTFVWDTANAFIDLDTGVTFQYTIAEIAPLSTRDFYWNVTVSRSTDAQPQTVQGNKIFQRREFHITAVSDQFTLVSTPTPRELIVEDLVSQNRNDVVAFTGPTAVFVGEEFTWDFVLDSSTATQGYEQLTTWSNFPPTNFRYLTTNVTYSAFPTGQPATVTSFYADGCTWDNDPLSPDYLSCLGTGKYGGTATSNITVTAVAAAKNIQIFNLIYDFSGSSFHYNLDFDDSISSIDVFNPALLGNLVWDDSNLDGIFDPLSESGIAGVELTVTEAGLDGIFDTADDTLTEVTTTDGNGNYQFDPLFPGSYRVAINVSTLPVGYSLTPAQTTTEFTVLVEGQTDESLDFAAAQDSVLAVDLASFDATFPDFGEFVTVSWSTETETDNLGFNVYRAVQGTKTYQVGEQLNKSLIPAEGGLFGATYSVVDPQPISGSLDARHYFLEDIDLSGKSTFHGPVNATRSRPGVDTSNVADWTKF